MSRIWEEHISLNSASELIPRRIGKPIDYINEKPMERFRGIDFADALHNDCYDLPSTEGREGYYGQQHFNYWLSGLKDSTDLLKLCNEFGNLRPERYLDFGGASGRVARHMAFAHGVTEVLVSDINREHINFVSKVFEGRIKAFQCLSIPHLPLEDGSLDLVSAYSIFTHIETFDDTWMLELRRILRPGGVLMVTANVDTFQNVGPDAPVYNAIVSHPEFNPEDLGKPLKQDRVVFRWRNDSSYSSVVYMTTNYVQTRYAPFFSKISIDRDALPNQIVIMFQK